MKNIKIKKPPTWFPSKLGILLGPRNPDAASKATRTDDHETAPTRLDGDPSIKTYYGGPATMFGWVPSGPMLNLHVTVN